jgi:presqualene diphosphate synthase
MNDAAAASAPVATGSSFYAAMRILPQEQRDAMYSVYGFCRAVDDIADGGGLSAWRMAELERWRADIAALFAGQAPSRLADLGAAVRRYGLKQADFEAVIDGMAMDAEGDIRAPDWTTLDLYCDRVASAVGRLSVRIFGLGWEAGEALAHHLGRALQLTNILRDIDEDAAIGRLYLPREALVAAGITTDEPLAVAGDPRLAGACPEVAQRARLHFDEAGRVMASAPRRHVRAPRLMAAAYGSILDKMVAQGFAPPRRRIKASRMRILGALLRYGII